MVEKETDIRIIASELVKRINEDSRRVRLLEQRMERVDNSVSGLEDNILEQLDNLKTMIERLSEEIAKTGDRLDGLDNGIGKIRKDLEKTATRTELKGIESFIDLVNPLTSKFVTKNEMDRELEEIRRKHTKA